MCDDVSSQVILGYFRVQKQGQTHTQRAFPSEGKLGKYFFYRKPETGMDIQTNLLKM